MSQRAKARNKPGPKPRLENPRTHMVRFSPQEIAEIDRAAVLMAGEPPARPPFKADAILHLVREFLRTRNGDG